MTDDTKPESASERDEKLAVVMSTNGVQAGKMYAFFVKLIEWAGQNRNHEIRFTCPDNEKLQAEIDRQEKTISYLRAALKFYANTGGGIAIDALARTEVK